MKKIALFVTLLVLAYAASTGHLSHVMDRIFGSFQPTQKSFNIQPTKDAYWDKLQDSMDTLHNTMNDSIASGGKFAKSKRIAV